MRCPSVELSRCSRTVSPRSARAISDRDEKSAPIEPGDESAITMPRRSTITTRPRVERADVATTSAGEAPPAYVAAVNSAALSACVSTSAFTRSRTERTSGTSIDPIASTST